MKIEISIIECTKEIDGWTERTSEKDAERIELCIKSFLNELSVTYFTKKKILKTTSINASSSFASLFKECPFRSGEHESALNAIEEEINRYSKIPSSIDVIWNGK